MSNAEASTMRDIDYTTFLNDDLLHVVSTYCGVPELQALRLVNRQSNAVASCYLFQSMVIRPLRKDLDRLQRVSKKEVFAKGVREIIWETGWLRNKGLANELPLATIASSYQPDLTTMRMMDRGAREGVVPSEGIIKLQLSKAFKAFTGLTSAALASWARSPGRLQRDYDSIANVPSEESEGRRITPYWCRLPGEGAMQTRDLRLLLEALTTPERSLDTFVVHPMDDKTGALASPMHVLQTVHFNSFSESQIIDLTHPLQNLRSLQLKLVDSSLDMLTRFWADEYGKLEVFLSRLQNLEHLYLCCWTIPRQNGRRSSIIGELPNDLYFPRLRSLSLNSFWMEAWGLSNFLLRHTSTLEEIELLHMNLFFNKSNGTTVYIHEKGEGVNRIESVKSLWMDTEWDESIDGPDLYAARNTTREADEVDEGTADSEALEDSTAQQTQLPHACEVRPNLAGPGIAKTGKSKILSLSPWKLVTDTCTTLPKLQGLQLVHPLVSFLPVPPTISRSLEDRGMNGRPNLFR